MRRVIPVLIFLLAASPAWATTYVDPVTGKQSNGVVCESSPGVPGCGAGTGGTANQGTPNAGGAAAWWVQWSGQSVGLSAGSQIIGKVGIDQTTPGTTNAVQQVAIANVTTTAAATNAVVKSGAGNLFSVVTASSTANYYVMLFDATSLPSNGASPANLKAVYGPLSATTDNTFSGPPPIAFSTGMTIGCSSTGNDTTTGVPTLTAVSCYKFNYQVQ